jgi:hypothetical protein
LISDEQIDTALGGRYTPEASLGGIRNGYLSPEFVIKYRNGSELHKRDSSLSIIAYANCVWTDRSAAPPASLYGGHPTFRYSLVTYSSPVSEAEYIRVYGRASRAIRGLGQWASFNVDELVTAIGPYILSMTNVEQQTGVNLQPQYTKLAHLIVRQLG